MGTEPVTTEEIERAFAGAGVAGLSLGAYEQFLAYFTLLVRWNSYLNLTAIREPEEIIQRHFVECAFAAQYLPRDVRTLLDYGSGAGLPGIPVAICRPEIRVTLAEAHGKKASFLQEAVRTVGISTEVYDGRVETMPRERQFDLVAIRAVEKMELALPLAIRRVRRYLALFTTERSAPVLRELSPGLTWLEPISLPNARQRVLAFGERV